MYDHQKVEKEILKFWEENKIFDKLREKNKGKEKFKFIDGPITANNPMGVHHAYSRTIKDLFLRYKALQGYDQRFQNGFDCHGLPVEVEVEKELGIKTKKDLEKYGVDNFIKKCRERVIKMAKVQTSQSIRLGQWMDWGNDYFTMSDTNIEHIWMFLKKCNDNGWIYKGTKVVPWCWRCGTTLSQHELAEGYQDLTHPTVFVRFKLKGKENEYLLVWTTTHWTLTSNVACAVGPDVVYAKAEKDGKIYYLSKATADVLGEHKILETIQGSQLIGVEYEGPYDHLPAQKGVAHKVVGWDLVGESDGTGIVHIAPGCGAEDFDLGKQENLAEIAPLDENGYYIDGFDWLTGKHVKEVREPITKDLESRDILFKEDKITHRYPTCWRCKEELVFRLNDVWFIKSDGLREKLLALNKEIYWHPQHGSSLMEDWLVNLKDWNFSRSRYWGAPLPFWICSKCNHVTVVGSKKELEEKAVAGLDQLKDLHRPNIDRVTVKCDKCGESTQRVPEVADCWLDSGIAPYSTLNYMTDKPYWEQWFQAEFLSEMREQIRLWFYSLLFMSTVIEGKAPYKKVFIFEKVYDEKGEEMHKSGKNVIWFDEAVEKIGADVMRWLYAKTNPTQNVLFGFGSGKENENLLTYLVNIGDYMDKFLDEPSEPNELKPEDKWLLSRLESLKKRVNENMESLRFNTVTRDIEDFFVNVLSKQYIKFVRNRMKTDEKNKVAGLIYRSLLETVQLMSPFTPFLAEHLYQKHFRKFESKESVHLLDWPAPDESRIDTELEKQMDTASLVIETASSIRNKVGINLRQPLSELYVFSEEKGVKETIENLKALLSGQTNVKNVLFGTPKGDFEEGETEKMKVFLNKEIDDELAKEGLTRELTRRVQQMRKEAGLVEADKIAVSILPKLEINLDELKRATNAEQISESAVGSEKTWKIYEREIKIALKKL